MVSLLAKLKRGGRSSMNENEPQKRYQVTVGDWIAANNVTAMDLVRIAGIGVSTAYKAQRNDPSLSLDTLYVIYNGLKSAGYVLELKDVVILES